MEDTKDDFQLQIETDPRQYLRIVTDSVLSDYLWIVTPGISLRLLGDDYGEGRLQAFSSYLRIVTDSVLSDYLWDCILKIDGELVALSSWRG